MQPELRIDKLLWYLRLSKSRVRAQAILGAGHVRLNGRYIDRHIDGVSMCVRAGDVVTLPVGEGARGIDLEAPPAIAGANPQKNRRSRRP